MTGVCEHSSRTIGCALIVVALRGERIDCVRRSAHAFLFVSSGCVFIVPVPMFVRLFSHFLHAFLFDPLQFSSM